MFWSQPESGTRDGDPDADFRQRAAAKAVRYGLSPFLVLVAVLAWCGNLVTLSLGDPDSAWWRSLLVVWCLLILPGLAVAWHHRRQMRLPAGGADLDVLTRTAERTDLSQNSSEIIRTLREEIGRTMARQPGVVFAATLAGPGFHTGHRDNAAARTQQGSFWCAGARAPVWLGLSPASKKLFDAVRLEGERVVHEGDGAELAGFQIPADVIRGCHSWLMISAGSADQAPLLVLLGLRKGADREALQTRLQRLRTILGPLLSIHHHLTLTRSQISAARAENEALVRYNKMQGEFVAVASHELKTPLTSIGAYTEVLLQNIANPDFTPREEFLTIIKNESDRLLRMVNRILDFARIEFSEQLLQKELVALRPLITDTVTTLEPQLTAKRQKLDVECPDTLPQVEVDRDLIRQVLINLIGNAIKYSPQRGKITVRACEDAATVRIDVQDTGPGIPADELRSIFRQFYRVHRTSDSEEGAGLGLTIVKNIIDMHNGHVDVKSREDKGAIFSCHLPKEYVFNPARACLLGDLMAVKQFQQILRLSVRMVAELTESRVVVFSLLDEREENLLIQAALGLPARQVETARVSKDTSYLGRVIRSASPDLASAAEAQGLIAASQLTTDADALAAAPLVIGHRTIGAVIVADKMNATPYDKDDLNLLATLCERISAALGAALNHRTDSQRLEEIVEAMQALVKMKHSSIPTVNPLALRLMNSTAGVLGFSPAEIKRLQYLVALHDAGMVRVDEDILHKAGVLNEDERDEVDSHVVKGADLMAPLLLNSEMKEIILTHHERMDGKGYPDGKTGVEIPLGSRILAVLDAFFAMIQERPYRDRIPPAEVVKEMRRQAGKQFDPMVVKCFLDVLQEEGIITAQADTADAGQGPDREPRHDEEQTWQHLES